MDSRVNDTREDGLLNSNCETRGKPRRARTVRPRGEESNRRAADTELNMQMLIRNVMPVVLRSWSSVMSRQLFHPFVPIVSIEESTARTGRRCKLQCCIHNAAEYSHETSGELRARTFSARQLVNDPIGKQPREDRTDRKIKGNPVADKGWTQPREIGGGEQRQRGERNPSISACVMSEGYQRPDRDETNRKSWVTL